jgi:Sap, sulfolipid-1-addressing protein
VGRVFALAFTAALNPTLLAAVTVMLTLERPKRLLSGYLAGAALTAVTCGLLLVFLLPGSSTSSSAKHTVNPIVDLTFGALILLVVAVVGTGRDRRRRAWSERRREKAKDKPPPRWKRTLSKGSARDTFVVGVLLSFPGASYIAGMDELSKQNLATAETVLAVLGFNVIMLALLEVPLLAYAIRPESTDAGVRRFSDWLSRRGGRMALIAAAVIGALVIARGVITLLS